MPDLAGSSKLLRAMNAGAALALLFERGRVTRGELRAATGLSKPTVSEVVRALVAADLALVDGYVVGGPGPNAEIYAVNPDAAHAVAVSVHDGPGGPRLTAARGDLTGAVRAELDRPVRLTGADPVPLIEAAVRELGQGLPGRLAQVQLGVPGSVDPATRTVRHCDLPGFTAAGLVDALAARIGVPVDLENDVNLATIAERRTGCAQDVDGFVLLWLGEGIGLGIDLGGTLLRGARGGAGEIGYLRLGPADPAGGPGMDLQDLLGDTAVRELARRYHPADAADPVLAGALAEPGFVAALADRIGLALAAVVAVLDPALLVLAGPLAQAGGPMLADAVAAALARATPVPPPPVARTAITGDPVIAGALHAALTTTRTRLRATLSPTP